MFGAPRNVLPSGDLRGQPRGTTVNEPVTLTAGFIDPDSRGGGGTGISTATAASTAARCEPTTTTTYATPGTFSPKVFAKDFRGGSGSASTGRSPSAAAPPPASKRPILSLPRSSGTGRARGSCHV